MMMTTHKHIIAALVENKPGVMMRISGLFARRGFNIESIAVGTTEMEGILKECISIISPAVSPGITRKANLTATSIIIRSMA